MLSKEQGKRLVLLDRRCRSEDDRTYRSLVRHGFVEAFALTDAGRDALSIHIAQHKCYACDELASGSKADGLDRLPACSRHRDSEEKVTDCMYCGEPTKSGSLYIDKGYYAHRCCHEEACGR